MSEEALSFVCGRDWTFVYSLHSLMTPESSMETDPNERQVRLLVVQLLLFLAEQLPAVWEALLREDLLQEWVYDFLQWEGDDSRVNK